MLHKTKITLSFLFISFCIFPYQGEPGKSGADGKDGAQVRAEIFKFSVLE